MPETEMRNSLSPFALIRAADAMLRCLGGTEISLLVPALNTPSDTSEQLGLVDPGVEQVRLAPVVVRNLPTAITGPRRRLEFLVSAGVVGAQLQSRNVATAEALFDQGLGVLHDGTLLHIEGFATEYFAGAAYLYRIVAVD